MGYLRREGKFFLQGMTVTFAFLAAIGTLSSLLLILVTTVFPGLRDKIGSFNNLQGQLILASALQTIGWEFLRHIQFVTWRLARVMVLVMAAVTLFFLTLALFSLLPR
ncbi:MAG TPA: hypothetical protein V6C57_09495 [Coleofasciculaceae cyanobacterium]